MKLIPRSLYKGSYQNWSSATKWTYSPPGPWTQTGTTLDFVTSEDAYSHNGYDIEHFHLLLKQRKLLPLTYWKQQEITGGLSVANHELTVLATGLKSKWVGLRPLISTWQIPSSWTLESLGIDTDEVESLGRRALQAAASNIYSRGWDALTFAAELHKTIQMFTNLLRRTLEGLRKADWSGQWLETRYGWRILKYDIQDIQKLLFGLEKKRSEVLKERVGYKRHYVQTGTTTYTDVSGTRYYSITDEFEVSVRGNVLALAPSPKLNINPFTTAWEIVPYSFIVDWFFDVGQWLEALSFLGLATHTESAWGYKVDGKRTTSLTSVAWSSGWTGDSELQAEVNLACTTRIPSSVPYLPLVNPSPLSIDQLRDLLSLLGQRLR